MNLVLLHGWATDGRIWARQRAALQGRVNLLTPDWPGWEAEWLAGYLAPLPPARTVVGGWSLGGLLLVEALAHSGYRPRAVVLVGTGASFCRRADYPRGVAPTVVRAMRRRLPREPEAVVREFFELCLAPGEEEAGAELAGLIPPAAPERWAAGLDVLTAADTRPWLGSLDGGRTLIVQGSEDRICPREQGEHLAGAVPGSRLALAAGAGHLPFFTRPDWFNNLLIEYCDGH